VCPRSLVVSHHAARTRKTFHDEAHKSSPRRWHFRPAPLEHGCQMSAVIGVGSGARDADLRITRCMVLMVLALTFALRLLHLRSAMHSPLTYQPGPDEDYYFRLAREIAEGGGIHSAEFAFMDPAYGYILGSIFKLLGPNLYVVYLLQILVDTATAYCIFLIGREFGRPRGGLYAALLYGLTCTAVLFTTTLLKATWVANYMALWVLFGLILLRTRKQSAWLFFGMLCGYGVALRSNLLLMACLAAVLLPWLNVAWSQRSVPEAAHRVVVLVAGLALPIALLALRNDYVSNTFSPLPNNGGVVLHQLYNAENPRAETWFPRFVTYAHPSEIWRGYTAEAQRRLGHDLTPHEVDQYWRGEAVAYIESHPINVLGNVFRKLCEFVAYTEVPNNRSLTEERLFSPVLRALPSPFAWLFALGVPGIALLLFRDRRAVLVVGPIFVVAVTVAIFFAEDRFRFQAVPMFALGAGLFLDDLLAWIKNHQTMKWVAGISISALLASTSILLAQQMPQHRVGRDRAIWGYIKMGNKDEAKILAMKAASEEPMNSAIQEALGHIAAEEGRASSALEYYRRAVELKPDSHVAHYNLAKLLIKIGDEDEARKEAAIAVHITPLPQYQRLLEELTLERAPK
jgi:4-amino-4-deoxy-L-arabinose transferase-like glycosyltransferase